ncbi:MAG: hypothetical protein AAF249_16390 [Pseudomonadota bacterium]
MTEFDPTLTDRFERFEIVPTEFWHLDHVQVAFEMFERYDFIEACSRYASTIRKMATDSGAPAKYNATITIAFMSLVAERKACSPDGDLTAFFKDNPDMLDKKVLCTWYSPKRMTSSIARQQFLMPDKINGVAYEQATA